MTQNRAHNIIRKLHTKMKSGTFIKSKPDGNNIRVFSETLPGGGPGRWDPKNIQNFDFARVVIL